MALSNLVLLQYHNYYSRKCNKCTTLQKFYNNGAIRLDVIKNYNFKLNNGITTNVILNNSIDLESGLQADYLIECDEEYNVKTSWYIMSINKIREEQYQLNLQRDVVNDYYKFYFNQPSMIGRCMLPENSNYILNKETLSFNQIKVKETLLYDRSKCGWLVGYIPKTTANAVGEVTANILGSAKSDFTFSSWKDFKYYSITSASGGFGKVTTNKNLIKIDFRVQDKNNVEYYYRTYFDLNKKWGVKFDNEDGSILKNSFVYKLNEASTSTCIYQTKSTDNQDEVAKIIGQDIEMYLSYYLTFNNVSEISSIELNTNEYNAYINKVFKVGENNYSVNFERQEDELYYDTITDVYTSSIVTILNNKLPASHDYYARLIDFTSNDVKGNLGYNNFQLITYLIYDEYKVNIPDDASRVHLANNCGYDIFILPFSDDISINGLQSNKKVNLAIANAIMTAYGTYAIDLQLLPYCPFVDKVNLYNNIDITDLNVTEIKSGENIKGYLIWLTEDSFKSVSKQGCGSNDSKKILNETKMWRLCSPNYSSQFEFNIAKLGGQAGPFTVDVSLKPYNPYIRVAPAFSDLYGGDFGDKRGLILAGDYSLPIISNAWTNYELNNKNYEKAFNRNIESLEYQNKYSRLNDITSAISGTVGAGVSGAFIGGGVGAGIAGIASASAGVADIFINQNLRNENISKQKDLFNYQIDNIKAMPTTVNKGTPLDINYKMWPVVEEYSASDEEIEEFKEFIKYRGMTANIVDTIENVLKYKLHSEYDFEYRYIECLPIDLDSIGNYQIAQFLSNELQNGIYFKEVEE